MNPESPRTSLEAAITETPANPLLGNNTRDTTSEPMPDNVYSDEESQRAEAVYPVQSKEHPRVFGVQRKPFWMLWALELISISCSFATFVVAVIILSKFDQQSLPNWPLRITLNTLLAFFSTVSKATFMFPVSTAISSSQWLWFSCDRPLLDFHRFDQASRGAWGSLALLWNIQHRHSVSIGAIITIINALTSPLTQLAISYRVRNTQATGDAIVGTSHVINGTFHDMAGVSRKAIILSTALDKTRFLEPIRLVGSSCSTGNCTFEPYEAIGVCVTQANVSSQLSFEQGPGPASNRSNEGFIIQDLLSTGNISLPGGYEIAHGTGYAVLSDMLNGNETFGFNSDPNLLRARIASFVLLYSTPIINNDWSEGEDLSKQPLDAYTDITYEALEFLFHICVQTYETHFHEGFETTQMTASSTIPVGNASDNFLDINCTNELYDQSTNCTRNRSKYGEILHLKSNNSSAVNTSSSSLTNDGFWADFRGMEDMATNMKITLSGSWRAEPDPSTSPIPRIYFTGYDFISAIYETVLYSEENLVNLTRRDLCLANLYKNVAIALSAQIRLVQSNTYMKSAFNVSGQAWKQESYAHIEWAWLSFLAAELILSTMFLAITIVNQRISDGSLVVFQDIKESSLALLVALGDKCRAMAGSGVRPMAELKDIAEGLIVRLEGNQISAFEGGK